MELRYIAVRASEIIVVKSESGQYISDGSPREVSPVLREEVKMKYRSPPFGCVLLERLRRILQLLLLLENSTICGWVED